MADTFEQFIAFGTDSSGIERILRLFQSICHILISFPLLLTFILPEKPQHKATAAIIALTGLRSQINVSRRFIRLFRFLGCFNAGYRAYVVAEKAKGIDPWLDIVSTTCFGLYGFLESATMLDVLEIDGLDVFGRAKSRDLNYQAQIFWFAALYASVVSTGLKLFRIFAHRSVPKTGEGYGTGEKPGQKTAGAEKGAEKGAENTASTEVSEKTEPSEKAKEDTAAKKKPDQDDELKKERERLKGIVAKNKAERRAWLREVSAEVTGLGKKMVTEMTDIILPCAALGWISVHPGVVGIAMFCTTIATGLDVWHRCGRNLAKKSA